MSDFDNEARNRSTNDQEKRAPLGFLLAAAVVVLLVVMGVFVVIANRGDDDTPATNGGTSRPSPSNGLSTTPAADADASLCGLESDGGDETALTEPPADVTWELIGKIAIPSSKSAGPGVIEDSGVRYCYAHTPAGALLATVNFYSWPEGIKNDPVAVVEHGVASGPGYEAALEEAKAGPEQTEQTVLFQIRGYRIVSYSESSALVDVAYSSAAGFTHQQLELAWEQGDWRLRGAPDGSLPEHSALPDLTGYVPWAGA